MQQFVRTEAATNAGAKKYFNAAPARMQRFFHKFTCRPLCVCIWEWHQVVFLCVWQRRGNGKCMSELKWRSSISNVLVSKGFCGVRNDIQVFYITFHSNKRRFADGINLSFQHCSCCYYVGIFFTNLFLELTIFYVTYHALPIHFSMSCYICFILYLSFFHYLSVLLIHQHLKWSSFHLPVSFDLEVHI